MSELVLGPVLRHVDAHSASIWVETDAPSSVEVLGCVARTFEVAGHHYAMVVVDGLVPGATVPYAVSLDGVAVWPPAGWDLPPSVIRTHRPGAPVRVVFGSCRAAAPHEPPYTLELDRDDEARGVDALWAYAHRMADMPPHEWPDVALFTGDQVYADDSSPMATARIEARRARRDDHSEPPAGVVADFEEYTWLYREAWSQPLERWFLSVVPSAMIADDHDVIDDWNISSSWCDDIQQEPWWAEHLDGAMRSYGVYQHLGNLPPDEVAAAQASVAAGRLGRLGHVRCIDGVRIVTIDCRTARRLTPGDRRMVDDADWEWVEAQLLHPCEHLVVVTSLPVFVPPGLHGLQQWDEAVCDGAWGRRLMARGERIRRGLDLEDWSAFSASFDAMVELLGRVQSHQPGRVPPQTVTIVSGDIHFAYVAAVSLPTSPRGVHPIRQVVSSPMRNALITPERGVIHFSSGRIGSGIGRLLARLAGCPPVRHRFELETGPWFSNNIGTLVFDGSGHGRVVIEQAALLGDAAGNGEPVLTAVVDRSL